MVLDGGGAGAPGGLCAADAVGLGLRRVFSGGCPGGATEDTEDTEGGTEKSVLKEQMKFLRENFAPSRFRGSPVAGCVEERCALVDSIGVLVEIAGYREQG